MVPDGIKERFEFYRKWLKTLLVKEFLNLPSKYQEQFLSLINEFVENCKKIQEESKVIHERIIQLKVTDVQSPDNKEEKYTVLGTCSDLKNNVKYSLPITKPKPKIGAKLYLTVFSLDKIVWYSSKDELITKN